MDSRCWVLEDLPRTPASGLVDGEKSEDCAPGGRLQDGALRGRICGNGSWRRYGGSALRLVLGWRFCETRMEFLECWGLGDLYLLSRLPLARSRRWRTGSWTLSWRVLILSSIG